MGRLTLVRYLSATSLEFDRSESFEPNDAGQFSAVGYARNPSDDSSEYAPVTSPRRFLTIPDPRPVTGQTIAGDECVRLESTRIGWLE
ncbi:hypothetical protein B1756_01185 [Natrarchaeobaculum aegyptiacum]|uniref:Uncharacterized protein n=1 Tax=Natrarchaeobaculum aegyptiacum TaxID=745377 RepID=A0A2Z2HNK3_9EURY|nr:hypothetical protein B1756_01185 [Natrarchaeobaculum aegyptiacum]